MSRGRDVEKILCRCWRQHCCHLLDCEQEDPILIGVISISSLSHLGGIMPGARVGASKDSRSWSLHSRSWEFNRGERLHSEDCDKYSPNERAMRGWDPPPSRVSGVKNSSSMPLGLNFPISTYCKPHSKVQEDTTTLCYLACSPWLYYPDPWLKTEQQDQRANI